MSDETILRRRIGDLKQNKPNLGQGSPAYLGRTYDGGSYPTEVPRMFLTRPLSVVANEAEGEGPTYVTEDGASVPVLILGPEVPEAGSNIVARLSNGLWVAGRSVAGEPLPTGVITIRLTECGVNAAGRTISLTDGTTTFNQVTDSLGVATFNNVPDGSWTAILAGDANWNDTVLPPIVISGGSTVSREMNRSPKSGTCSYRLDLWFTGCNNKGFAGASIQLTNGTVTYSSVLDADGHWFLFLPSGSFTWSLTHNIDVSRGTIQGNPTPYTFVGRPIFGGLSFNYSVATANFHCITSECVYPIPNLLTVDTSDQGAATYQWTDSGPGNRTWQCITPGKSGYLYVPPSTDQAIPVVYRGTVISQSYTVVSCWPFLATGTVTYGGGGGSTFTYTISE